MFAPSGADSRGTGHPGAQTRMPAKAAKAAVVQPPWALVVGRTMASWVVVEATMVVAKVEETERAAPLAGATCASSKFRFN